MADTNKLYLSCFTRSLNPKKEAYLGKNNKILNGTDNVEEKELED